MRPALAHRSRSEDLSVRLRVAHMMECASFEPAGLPPSAILLVRRFPDPQPRAFLPQPSAIRPGLAWERAAQSRLEDLHRRAARPALGFVPAGCESVLFADPGEMLACLAYDWLHGNASGVWWWQLILRTLPAGLLEGWIAAWQRQPRYVPAALRILTERRAAVDVVASLSSAEAWTMFLGVVREFELSLDITRLSPEVSGEADTGRMPPSEEAFMQQSKSALPTQMSAVPSPWHASLPLEVVPYALGVERSALLGVSLMLQYAPEAAHSRRFSRQFREWYLTAQRNFPKETGIGSAEPALEADSQRETITPPQNASVIVPGGDGSNAAIPFETAAGTVTGGTPTQSNAPPGTASGRSETSQHRLAQRGRNIPQTQQELVEGTASNQRSTLFQKSLAQTRTRALPTDNQVHPPVPGNLVAPPPLIPQKVSWEGPSAAGLREISLDGEAIPTELGGVLFLVNVLRALKLPQCLEWEFGVEGINGWTLLELIARCLLGPGRKELTADPVWDLLARLAERRPDVPIGSGFLGQQRYRLPGFWMSALCLTEPAAIGVRLRGFRLQLWHASGFALLDRTLDSSPVHRLIEAECESFNQNTQTTSLTNWRKDRYRALSGCSPLGMTLPGEFRRFLAFLLPYIRYRLALALGTAPTRSLDFAPELLLRRGRLHVSSTHIDLVMDMTQAAGRVRLSGLDADPGWVPELGRVVKFIFTSENAS